MIRRTAYWLACWPALWLGCAAEWLYEQVGHARGEGFWLTMPWRFACLALYLPVRLAFFGAVRAMVALDPYGDFSEAVDRCS